MSKSPFLPGSWVEQITLPTLVRGEQIILLTSSPGDRGEQITFLPGGRGERITLHNWELDNYPYYLGWR